MKNSFDITHRDGLGRAGTWRFGEDHLDIPMIAGMNVPDIPLIDLAELVICHISDRHVNGSGKIKLQIAHRINPLLDSDTNFEISKSSDVEVNESTPQPLSLLVPDMIQYPESFAGLGIPPNAVYPRIKNQVQDNFIDIQSIASDDEALRPGPGIIFFQNALQLFNKPRVLARRIISLEHRSQPGKLLYLPGVATVNNLAILVYLGIDIIDTTQCILQARAGNLMMPTGPIPNSAVKHGLCTCPGCMDAMNLVGKDKDKEKKPDKKQAFENILKHNEYALFTELALVKTMLARGTLRELVEQRLVSEPRLTEIIRILDLEHYQALEPFFPVYRNMPFISCSHEALNRVEVVRFRDRVRTRYEKPSDASILILLPCSAKKPYSTSRSHRSFRYAVQNGLKDKRAGSSIHEVIVTSPLGLVPRELELVYPAQQYDIPTIGHWYEDELNMIRSAISDYISKNHYKHILIHLSEQLGQVVEECIRTASNNLPKIDQGHLYLTSPGPPTAKSSLEKLTETLASIFERSSDIDNLISKPSANKNSRQFTILRSIARFQFGPPGEQLIEGCRIRGRYPNLKLFKNNQQIGMLTGERGLISLTMAGARELVAMPEFGYSMVIDDFVPSGSIMAVGVVKASEAIRIGDEVVACYNDEVRAVGQAVMTGSEMTHAERGAAVKVRHHI